MLPSDLLAAEIKTALGKLQKELPCAYLYDEVGSALFDVITLLPEYGLTRAEARILQRHADDMAARLPASVCIVELGSGSGVKTRLLLDACLRRFAPPLSYYPIDISAAALARCRQELSDLSGLGIHPLEQRHLDGLRAAAGGRAPGQHLLVLFLGSSIGNFDRPAADSLLCGIRRCLAPGDALLLGADLMKPREIMLAAYDDPIGATAAFNRNLLAHVNRLFDGDFDPRAFEHEARYNEREQRVEMHLRSLRAQKVSIRALGFTAEFEEGETIWTESCHKYHPADIAAMARRCGFECEDQWIDEEWPFADSLLMAC